MTWSAHDDARLRAWLRDEAPERAPSTVLSATFDRTRTLPRGAARTRRSTPRLALLLAAGLALATLAAGAMYLVLSRPPVVPPAALAQPRFLGDFLWSGGYAFEVDVAPPGAVDADAVVGTAVEPEISPFLGPPDPPIFGRLRCIEPGLCGPDVVPGIAPADAGTDDTWSVWVLEYPQEEAYRVFGAWDGRLIAGFYGNDLQTCSRDEVGKEPGCTADTFAEPRELPVDVRSALAIWGQDLPYIETEFTTTRDDNTWYWPADQVDPMTIAATLVDKPTTVDAFQGVLGCQRASCPEGIVKAPGEQRMVAIIVVDDGARWVIVDADSGEVLASDETPVRP